MSTIQQLKTNHDTVIRQKTLPKSISTDNQADLFDGLADELLDRGVAQAVDTTALQALSGVNYKNVVVKDNGIYLYKSSGTPNGTTIFAATGGGVYEKQYAGIKDLIIDVTYSELVDLIDDSELIPGVKYRITDFATRHFLINPDITNSQDLNVKFTGDIETLIVTAIDVNKLDKVAISPLYPQDVIHYDWNPANWLTDVGFSDVTDCDYVDPNTATIIDNFEGVIYYRHDTRRNNKFGYDFRQVTFRRYKSNPTAWDSDTTYAIGDVVKYTSGLTTKVYVSMQDSNLNQTPEQPLHSNYWIETVDLTKTDKWAFGSNSFNLVPTDSNIFQDIKTFNPITANDTYDTLVSDNDFTPRYSDITWTNKTILTNTVYHLDADLLNNNKINLTDSTLTTPCYFNIFFGFKNIIGKRAYTNDMRSFSQNLIGDDFSNNISYSNQFLGNRIDGTFGANTLDSNSTFVNNFVGFGFGANRINAHIVFNLFGKNLRYNELASDMGSLNLTADLILMSYTYQKKIYNNSANVLKLEYLNAANVLTIANPTD